MANVAVIDLTEEFDKTPSPYSQRLAVLQGYQKPLYLLNQKELEERRKKSLQRRKKEKEEIDDRRYREQLGQAKADRLRKALQEQIDEGKEQEALRPAMEELDRLIREPLNVDPLGDSPSMEDLYDELRRQDPNIIIPVWKFRKARGSRRKNKRSVKRKPKRKWSKWNKYFKTHKKDLRRIKNDTRRISKDFTKISKKFRKRRHPHKGQYSRTRKGRKDFITHKGDIAYNKRRHRQYKRQKPYRTRKRK